MKYASSTFSFGAYVALSLALASVPATGEYDCSVCYNLTTAQEEALASYDNGGKKIICDPTCLDESGVTDPAHCNYFELGQICRGCGDCTTCTSCPPSTLGPTMTPITSPTSAPTPTWIDVVISTTSGLTTDDYDCSVCENLTTAQDQALASYDNGGKNIVCDPTCLDNSSDPSHCNYFGLGQICRGCGNCSECMACPTPTPSLYTTGYPTSESVTTTTPVPATTDVKTPSPLDSVTDDFSACSNLTITPTVKLCLYLILAKMALAGYYPLGLRLVGM